MLSSRPAEKLMDLERPCLKLKTKKGWGASHCSGSEFTPNTMKNKPRNPKAGCTPACVCMQTHSYSHTQESQEALSTSSLTGNGSESQARAQSFYQAVLMASRLASEADIGDLSPQDQWAQPHHGRPPPRPGEHSASPPAATEDPASRRLRRARSSKWRPTGAPQPQGLHTGLVHHN